MEPFESGSEGETLRETIQAQRKQLLAEGHEGAEMLMAFVEMMYPQMRIPGVIYLAGAFMLLAWMRARESAIVNPGSFTAAFERAYAVDLMIEEQIARLDHTIHNPEAIKPFDLLLLQEKGGTDSINPPAA